MAQQPVITSFSPLSGPVGSYVNIKGVNFSTAPAGNIVYFGGVKATITKATDTVLTVTVPVGGIYKPVTVTCNGVTAYSNKIFVTTFAGSDSLSLIATFAPPVTYQTTLEPVYMAAADFDGDGKIDIAVVNTSDGSIDSNSFSVFQNTGMPGNISFGSNKNFTTGTEPRTIAIGDVDGDGKLDVVVSNFVSATVSVFKNISTVGNINFATKIDYPVAGGGADGLAIADIDGDGRPDIVASGTALAILRNITAGGVIAFANKVQLSTPKNLALGVALADFDADGKPDIAAVNLLDSSMSIFKNTSTIGTLAFDAGMVFKTGINPYGICAVDIDGDGKLDLVVANAGNSIDNNTTASMFKNNSTAGTISFSQQTLLTTPESPLLISAGDLTGDGKPDISITNNAVEGLPTSLFRNTSSLDSFSFVHNNTDVVDFIRAFGSTIADFDGDGKADLVIGKGSNPFYLYVYRNSPSVILPLQLLSFNGQMVGKITQLQWKTVNELNASAFDVQRSQNSIAFSTIGTVKAAGNSSTQQNYAFTDAQPFKGDNFYRLKMTDADGLFTFSNVIKISVGDVSSTAVYPNPANAYVVVNKPEGCTQLQVVDMGGKPVKAVTCPASASQTLISVSDLPAGNYIVRYVNDNKTENKIISIVH